MLDRIYIEISNLCNVQCSFCPVVDRDKKIMSPSDFEKILLEAKPKAKEVCLHLMGEPTAHPQFKEILNITEKHDVLVQLTTNGLLIKRYTEFLLSKNNLRQINFSLQSYTDNFPEKELDPYMSSIMSFCEKASVESPQLYINLRVWNLGDNENEEHNEKLLRYIEDYLQVDIKRKTQVENIKSKRLKDRIYLHFDSRFKWPSPNNEYLSSQGRCNGLLRHIGIHADGDVVPCCLDKEADLKLGNIYENDLEAILQGQRARKMREGFLNGRLVESMCQSCDFVRRFRK